MIFDMLALFVIMSCIFSQRKMQNGNTEQLCNVNRHDDRQAAFLVDQLYVGR